MRSKNNNINKIIRNISFGEVYLSKEGYNLYDYINYQIPLLCKSLPEYMQNRAMLFMLNYSNVKLGEPLEFYKNFYKPIWTIITAISESKAAKQNLSEKECNTALTGQAMALFLHSLDDHLNDDELPPDHLLLLLRSQAWLLFNNAIDEFAADKNEKDMAEFLINEYYEGICPDKQPVNMGEYCDLFTKEISTVYIMPVLAAMKTLEDPDSVQKINEAIGHFGLAWRLIDDIQDLEEDLAAGRHTAVYFSLPEEAKKQWDSKAQDRADGKSSADIREQIFRELASGNILEKLCERIVRELDKARETAEALGMHRLGEQYKAMGEPIKKYY